MPGCGKGHHYLIHSSGENVVENCLRHNSRDTPDNQISGDNARQPVAEPHSNLAFTRAKTVNAVTPEVVDQSGTVRPSGSEAVCLVRASRPRVYFKVVPVKISCQGSTREITTYAFLDRSSDATFCLQSLAQELGMKGMKPTSFTMTTANLKEERFDHEVRLDVESLDGDAKFQLTNVLTTDSLPFTRRHEATNEDLRR